MSFLLVGEFVKCVRVCVGDIVHFCVRGVRNIVRVYWEEVYGGLGFEIVVLGLMVLSWVVLDEDSFDVKYFLKPNILFYFDIFNI